MKTLTRKVQSGVVLYTFKGQDNTEFTAVNCCVPINGKTSPLIYIGPGFTLKITRKELSKTLRKARNQNAERRGL